jgi:hypothetical protein
MTSPTDEERAAAKRAQAIKSLIDDLQTVHAREYQRFNAEHAILRFQSFVKAGFTEQRA